MKIAFIGVKGFPYAAGSFATFTEELGDRLYRAGHQVHVYKRSNFPGNEGMYKNMYVHNVYALPLKNFNAISNVFLSWFHLLYNDYDIIHIHGIGPAILLPLYKLLKARIVVHIHAEDQLRKKWSLPAKQLLKIGLCFALKFSDALLMVSDAMYKKFEPKTKKPIYIVRSGVNIHYRRDRAILYRYSLKPRGYFFMPVRISPEKNIETVIKAFNSLSTDKKLFICGDAEQNIKYKKKLFSSIKNKRIIINPPIYGYEYEVLFSNAYFYINSSFVEGLSQSLLEAIYLKIPVLVSDIEGNRILINTTKFLFNPYNMNKLLSIMKKSLDTEFREENIKYIKGIKMDGYSWHTSFLSLLNCYRDLLKK